MNVSDGSTPQYDTYETHAKGIRVLPGQWRPHYPWEHIAWISPPWPSQDYVWLDFPEALFSSQGLLYLSHVNPQVESLYSHLPRVDWKTTDQGLCFERTLPNGVVITGSVSKQEEHLVKLELGIRNGSPSTLSDITLQTCVFLRAICEFSGYTRDNKFVHTPTAGWVPLSQALEMPEHEDMPYRVGWRKRGKRLANAPIIVVQSSVAPRFLAFTWGTHTLSLTGNAHHPCAHADPVFPELRPTESYSIEGMLGFFEANLDTWDFQDFTRRVR